LRTFLNQHAPNWDEFRTERDKGRLTELVRRIIPRSAILDTGTGTGVLLPYLLKALGSQGRVIALDYAELMLSRARSKDGFGERVDFIQATVADIPLRSEIFDLIVCYSSFPHFEKKIRALKEMRRVLKSGGRLVICHTSGRSEINRIHRNEPCLTRHILPAPEELYGLLRQAGYREIRINERDNDYFAQAFR
jgi:ubiquinone/menaquinone biosynthesis C-methylase UbiE